MLSLQTLLSTLGAPGWLYSGLGLTLPTKGKFNNSNIDAAATSSMSNNSKSLDRKLDRIGNLLQNFTPINTQVIDLPTLAKANSIGNAMLVGSI